VVEEVNSLPIFLTREKKYLYGVLFFAMGFALYFSANHFPILKPQQLPMTWLDRAIPFLPNTVWIYMSEYVFFVAVYASCRDMANLNKYLYSYLALQIISVVIFYFWPTTYPRSEFPLSEDMNALTYYAFSNLRVVDAPTNCCPSLHVSSVYLSSFIFLDDQRGKFPIFFTWGTAIALSTLTTKQHYVVDVITGLFMAMLFYWIFHRMVSYRLAYAGVDHAKR
jgi:hypothetical protein